MRTSANYRQAEDNFFKARARQMIREVLSLLSSNDDSLLPFDRVKSIVKPTSSAYRGVKAVRVDAIMGSEDRYKDFNEDFLPRRDELKGRWQSIDVAHLENVTLPPVRLYKLGGAYFVRDGNHRISVARSRGVEFVDAEITELDSDIEIDPNATRQQVKKALIEYEQKGFCSKTRIKELRPDARIEFTEAGRYDELLEHIDVHKYFINQGVRKEISYADAVRSWYDNVYVPVVESIQTHRVLLRFPGRTESDLYAWTVKHWDDLKRKYGQGFSLGAAVDDYSKRHGKSFLQIFGGVLKAVIRSIIR